MRLRLIVNPTASSVTPVVEGAVADALSVGHELDVAETTSRGHAASLASAAADERADAVVVLAGDGTLNEAAQGLVGRETALAALPGGSTNVFARTLGVAFDPLDACAQLLASLDAPTRRIGVGSANDGRQVRRFLFHLGAGFDAATVREMELRHAHLKRWIAHPAFAVTTVDTWLRRYDRTTQVAVTARDAEGALRHDVSASGPYVVVSNSDPYTYVGRRAVTLAPAAGLDRALAVTAFRDLRATLVLHAVAAAVAHGSFVTTSPDITQLADVWHTTLTSDRPFPWQVDGDYLGETSELRVRYEPDCLNLVVPRAPRARGPGRR